MSPQEPTLEARPGPHDLLVEQSPDRSLRLDREGRWSTLREGADFHRRCWDGSVVRRVGTRALPLDPGEVERVHERVRALTREWCARVAQEPTRVRFHADPADPVALQQRLAAAQAWSPARFARQAQEYRRAYPEDIRVLPPDRYHDLVLLPALGCPHGRCVFCTLFPEPSFRVLSEAAFDRHLARVLRLLGSHVPTAPGVFLGSASALSLPQPRLRAVLRRVRERCGAPPHGVASFLDADHAPPRTTEEFVTLREDGLRHVTLGLESGDPALREQLGKRGQLVRVREAVARAREAGLVVGLTLLVGAGGEDARPEHRRRSFAEVEALSLSRKDRVYLSPLEGALPAPGLEQELAEWRDQLRQRTAAQVVPYRLALFRHFA